jgi:hypothetical protein
MRRYGSGAVEIEPDPRLLRNALGPGRALRQPAREAAAQSVVKRVHPGRGNDPIIERSGRGGRFEGGAGRSGLGRQALIDIFGLLHRGRGVEVVDEGRIAARQQDLRMGEGAPVPALGGADRRRDLGGAVTRRIEAVGSGAGQHGGDSPSLRPHPVLRDP